MTEIVLPAALAFIMFALGLGLTAADFVRVAARPRDFLAGAASQVVLLPLVAFLLVSLWPLPPALALGVMVIAAAPGGATSNVLTAFARGDVALSISLTAVVSLLCVVTIPLIVVLSHAHLMGAEAGGEIPVAGAALGVFAIVTVPVLAGMAARRFAGGFADRFEPRARRISIVLFVLVLAGAVYKERANVVPYFAQAGAVTLVLNLAMMALAWLVARLFGSGARQRTAISIECGLQNGTLALAVATLAFGGGAVAIPAATYSLIMFATALLYIAALRRRPAPPDS